MSIENLKKILESEREIEALLKKHSHEFYNPHLTKEEHEKIYNANVFEGSEQDCIKLGIEFSTNRLLPLLQKAVEMAEFYGDRKNWSSIDYKSDCKDLITFNDLGVKSYNEKPDYAVASGGRRAREFLAEFTKLAEIKRDSE